MVNIILKKKINDIYLKQKDFNKIIERMKKYNILKYNWKVSFKMIVPILKKDYENKSIEKLIEVRNIIIKSLDEYEKKHIIQKDSKIDINEINTEPSLDIYYQINNTNLIIITELIKEKINEL